MVHLAGWYLDFRILFSPLFEQEFPNYLYNNWLSFRTELGSTVHHVLKKSRSAVLSTAYVASKTGLPVSAALLRTQLTIESNSLGQQNLIGYLIANLKPKLREERASQIHIPSWKLHFESHLCS